jgi:hypothetical protein
MTQKFYTDNILPQHLAHIKYLQQKYKRKILFQEDGDPSHGHRNSASAPAQLKRASHITNLKHPAQSPELNPIEAIWMIMKKRLRGGRWQTVAEFKAAIEREWRRITLSQIRRRIREMQARITSSPLLLLQTLVCLVTCTLVGTVQAYQMRVIVNKRTSP